MSLYVSVFLCGLWMCCWPVSELSVVDMQMMIIGGRRGQEDRQPGNTWWRPTNHSEKLGSPDFLRIFFLRRRKYFNVGRQL